MPHDLPKRRRCSVRLQGFNYAQPGAYFITVVTHGRVCHFGNVADGVVRLSDAGRVVEGWWEELSRRFPTVTPDERIVMPNHFHGIAIIGESRPNGDLLPEEGQPHRAAPTLADIVGWFKTMITNEYIRGVKSYGWQPFVGRLWQRNYHEHIIRHDGDLFLKRRYIQDNPAQ